MVVASLVAVAWYVSVHRNEEEVSSDDDKDSSLQKKTDLVGVENSKKHAKTKIG